jgi:hypothetical protein
MGKSKIRIILDTLKLAPAIIVSDIDVAWLRNPLPFLQRCAAGAVVLLGWRSSPVYSFANLDTVGHGC